MLLKIHLDLDCYFVSAERVRYPFLNNIPVAVAKSGDNKIFSKNKKRAVMIGDSGAFNSALEFANDYFMTSKDKNTKIDTKIILNMWKNEFIDNSDKLNPKIHGMVIAKSYEAKSYGIATGMSIVEALHRCPHLKIIPSDHLYYQLMSQELKTFLETKIPVLEQYSIDEFFGDLGGWIKDDDIFEFIKSLQEQIKQKFNLPISIAASKSKWIAKLATDKIKPYGLKVIKESEVAEFTKGINVNEFAGIGRSISKMLSSRGIDRLEQIQINPLIFNCYGKSGRDLYKRICGTDNEAVIAKSDRRSIGISRNFVAIDDRDEIKRRITILARYLSYELKKLNLKPTTYQIKFKYQYNIKIKKSITSNSLFSEHFLINLAKEMFAKLDIHKSWKIHYLSISSTNFITKSNQKTLSLLNYQEEQKHDKLTQALTRIRDKFGIDSIRWGSEV